MTAIGHEGPAATAGRSADPSGATAHPDETSQSRLVPQLRMMTSALLAAPGGKVLVALGAAIFVVIAATAYGQILINGWNKPFFDALSHRDLTGFIVQLGVFFLIAGFLLVLNVAQRWLVETLKLKLRDVLVKDLVQAWMQPRSAFWLSNAGPIGVNPDQRLHEDARKLCELSADLGTGLLQASILFVTFAGVLWVLSSGFTLRIGGHEYPVPGFLLWAAIGYAAAGSLLSYWIGRSLIERNADRYAREADLRSSLVWINEHVDGISLAAGEADEKRRVELDLAEVIAATRRLVGGLTNLTWVTAGFGWVTNVAPILVAAPLYFDERISFGGLMMAAAAFTQAQSSLRWFVDNFSVIADWRATLLRVANFRLAVTASGVPRAFESRIHYAEGEPGRIGIEGLEIRYSAGRDRLKESQVTVEAGERVLVVGAPGAGKSLLFQALAGLWPWGAGQVTRPRGEPVHYLPRGTPYLPRGTLREVLAYPQRVEEFGDDAYEHALRRLGLPRLVPLLDASRRWDRVLGQNEQLCLAFARATLHAPRWLLTDDIFGSLEDDALGRVIDVLGHELAGTGLIHLGRAAQAHDPLFTRVLHLVRAED
jgi:putative ATP-binding cassette transporter